MGRFDGFSVISPEFSINTREIPQENTTEYPKCTQYEEYLVKYISLLLFRELIRKRRLTSQSTRFRF